MALRTVPYQRKKAIDYANRWAYFRNPDFFDFSEIGGDCTNFASQCLLAGGAAMNFTPDTGWYYLSPQDRSAAWSGTGFLYRFLTTNEGVGPFASEVPIERVVPGDLLQFQNDREDFQHTPVITAVQSSVPAPDTILVAAHSYDCACRPLSSYDYRRIRFLHIEGIRYDDEA